MSKKQSQRLVYVFIIFGVMAVIISQVSANSSLGGDWATVNAGYIGTIPYLFMMALGLYFVINGRSGFVGTTLLFGLIGLVNAGLFNHLNTEGIWIDAFIDATTTITDIMTITLILWLVIGFIVGAIRR